MSPLRSLQRVFPFCARGIHLISCLTLFVCFSAPFAPAVAQDQPAADDEVLRVTTDLLLFPARVRDKNGKRPNGLTEKDFSLKDPDAVTSGLYFSAGVDRVAMVFALQLQNFFRSATGTFPRECPKTANHPTVANILTRLRLACFVITKYQVFPCQIINARITVRKIFSVEGNVFVSANSPLLLCVNNARKR